MAGIKCSGRVFSSGLAATMTVCSLLNIGDSVISCNDVYGGTNRFLKRIAIKYGIKHSMVNMTLESIEKHMTDDVKLVWIETPSNPILQIIDIRVVCDAVKKYPGVLVAVDNTFMSPYFQRPLELGADVVVHSVTKYINGHSDVIMGCVMTNNPEIAEHLTFHQLGTYRDMLSFLILSKVSLKAILGLR
ncbi:unnamed protein product [Soboliphyme baturini]|uniref:cystathionine gamma-lyase n=1 Tax=Soboliphyme baturini TaxID=241478 RepID=A0A183J7D8_9BILA|nr:unnamed protein product [Soboliphyme baturini]